MQAREILDELRALGSERNREGQRRYGIDVTYALGISVADIRKLARRCGRSHDLATELWDTGVHEARILASIVDEPSRLTRKQMESWALDFNSWDLVDHCCGNLFGYAPFAPEMAVRWSDRSPEFVKRAAFALMATLAHRNVDDEVLLGFLPVIEREATDDRNFVRKAVNWALREIGKRNPELNRAAIVQGERIRSIDARAARWIASDALRELRSDPVQQRLKARAEQPARRARR